MAERACRNFQPNIFNKNKCQNCYKLQDAHRSSQSSLDTRPKGVTVGSTASVTTTVAPTTFKVFTPCASKTVVVKCGLLSLLIHDSSKDRTKTHENKWNRRWFVLNSTGVVDFFVYDELHFCASEVIARSLNLDDCTNMFSAEVDTGEPFSHGLNTPDATYYFKADNRLEIDNWIRVFKPFVQAASAFPFRRGNRNSVGSIEAIEKPAVVLQVQSHCKFSFSPQTESLKLQLEKLQAENRLYKENQTVISRQREAMHILEQELKTKANRITELEKEHSKCKDYQRAIIFQEKELQDFRYTVKDLRQQLEETEKKSKQHKGKLSIHAKELAEAKADLDEAISIISIHKANIESLKSELSSIRQEVLERSGKVILTNEEPESDRVFSFEANGDTGEKKDIEAKLKFLVQKLKQNERELLIKTRELEKANESRSKVAKYTRALLQELETKLSNNERKLAETEHQLNNSTIELEYEQEQRAKLEKENEKLADESERLQDLNKKAHLSGDAFALMQEAKKEKASDLDELRARLSEAERKLKDAEKEITLKEKDFVNEMEILKSKLESSKELADNNETMYRDCKAELQKAREKSYEVRRMSQELEIENETKLQQVITAKGAQLKTVNHTISKLENENFLLSKKNEELESQLDSMDEKLCQSLEKQFALSEENEKLTNDKAALDIRVETLQDDISDLKLALSDMADDSNIEAEQDKVHELEKQLDGKVKDLQSVQSVLNEREKELQAVKVHYEKKLFSSEKAEEEKRKDIEKKLDNLQDAMDIKLREKNNDLKALRNDMVELQKELTLLETSQDETPADSNRVEELEQQVTQYEIYLIKAKETIMDFEIQVNDLSSRDRELETKNKELEKKISSLESEVDVHREKLSTAEERLLDYEVEEKLLTAELQKCKKDEVSHENQISFTSVDQLESDPNQMDESDYHKLLDEKTSELMDSENKVVELAEELDKRLTFEQETAEWIEGVEANLGKTEAQLVNARSTLLAKSQELEREKCNILDLVELSRKYIKELEVSLAAEKARVEELEASLKESANVTDEETAAQLKDSTDGIRLLETSLKDITDKLSSCEKHRDSHKARVRELTKELEETKQQLNERLDTAEKAHQKDMKKLSEETLKVSGAAKTEGDELRLRLTSRVITLQSDISELKAAHQTVIEKLKVRHKRELENARREAILENSMRQPIMESAEDVNASVVEMENEMKRMVGRYETQMEILKHNHQREMERLKRGSDHGEGLKTEVTQLQAELEEMSQEYMDEIEMLKNKHAEELEQLKTDMSVVIQASVTTSCSPTKDHAENTQQLKAKIKELETEMDDISQKYNEELRIEREFQQKELDQIRDDMMTVIQAVKSQQYDLDPDTEQLQRTVREQEDEIKRLKATRGGSDGVSENAETDKLKEANRVLTEDKEEVEKCLKRQEAATMFGLRRTEEMSNKIYQMQKEMEEIDRKYMKEINMYKDAYEREKDLKTSGIGDADDLSAENEELRLELEELRLKMEEDESLHENELQIYKEKLGQEKLLDVEHLAMKIKGLEDSIEEMKLEHQREIEELQESHAENVKNLTSEHNRALRNIQKETESSTSTRTKSSRVEEEHKEKVRTLEFKIEELESLLEVKKRRHKAEVKSLKERLDEEMQRRSEDVRNYETKLRECDVTRRPSISSGPGASEYFRKQLAEVRSDNRNLKDQVETLKEELVTLRSKPASSTEKPLKETKRLASESDVKTTKESKEPLRKTASDTKVTGTDASQRGFRTQTTVTENRNETEEKPTPKFTRQGSKVKTHDIKKAYKKLALQCHPDKHLNHFIYLLFLGSESNSDFFSFFCGSKQHCCLSSDGDPDLRYQEDYDDEDIDGEGELDSIMEIVKNRRKKGKTVPDDFHESKQQTAKKGKTTVPVAKLKPIFLNLPFHSLNLRAKNSYKLNNVGEIRLEMQQIAMQLEEKRKEDEEKEKQRKQMEIERQKRLEEERIKAQNEERKRREREQKEREKQQRQEQEKEERKRRQQEEEKKRKDEEDKRKKVEKEKAEKEKAARKSVKRQPQQQRTDQQQYPREIPPRFQKMKKQQQHMQQQQSQSTSYPSNQQATPPQNRAQIKPQLPVGKKKDPNRFASKEYAGLINETDDIGWPKGQSRGSGWVGSTEDWEQETDKWGAVDREWGGKEGTWQKVVDRTDNNTWPAVGTKTTGDNTIGNSDLISKSATSSSGNLVNTTASLPLDSKSRNVFSNTVNNQPSSSKSQDWSATSNTGSVGLDTWDSECDDSIDRALDAVDSKPGVAGAAGAVSWGGMGAGGLGGLIGNPLGWDAALNSKSDTPSNVKQGWVSDANPAPTLDSLSWSKTPGKGPKTKPADELDSKPTVTNTSTWGGTPADSSSAWVEKSEHSKKTAEKEKSSVRSAWDTNSSDQSQTSPNRNASSESADKLEAKSETSGWGDGAVSTNWGTAPEISGTACWDNALSTSARKVSESKDSKSNQEKGWSENAALSSNSDVADKEECADGSWDGWTTASSKRNRAPKPAPPTTNSDSNAWMSRSLKQLLDMGFKQEDADKALRANHMNIESAIGE
ncbi:hypothetical protein QZH41_011672 [Actinostola sp. cb2023]|nr:hypothetical protein QZH41_011672 [Actinostola sp. cb2023]